MVYSGGYGPLLHFTFNLTDIAIEFSYGQKLRLKLPEKPEIVYVATKDPEEDYFIKLCEHWPYNYGDPHFFIHKDKLINHIKKQNYGKQTKLKLS